MPDHMNDTTAPAQPTDEQLVEAEARKWADQALAIHRRTDLQAAVQKRFRELMAEAGIPEKSESEQVEMLAQNEFDQLRAGRHKRLAQARAYEMYLDKYPEARDPVATA